MQRLDQLTKRLDTLMGSSDEGLLGINTNRLSESVVWAIVRARRSRNDGREDAAAHMELAIGVLNEIVTQPEKTPFINEANKQFAIRMTANDRHR